MHFGPSRVTCNKGSEPQFWDTVYISEVNGARKVKSDAQVAMNKNSRPRVEIFFLRGGWGDSVATQIFPNFWNYPKRVELGSAYSGCRLIYRYRQGQQPQI